MIHRKRLAAILAVGLAAAVIAPAAGAATKTTKKKAKAKVTTKATTKATTAPAATQAPAVAAPAAGGKSGGKMVWGIGAESNGWLPSTQNWSIEGGQVSLSVIERLIAIDDKGDWKPWLLESMVPNSNYTSWKMTVRSGIKFHNGEPLNAEAVAANIASVRAGFITANVFLNLGACAVESEFVVTCATKKPWFSLPVYFAGSAGAIVAPAQIKANDAKSPIGTGPFKFKEWVPNVKFVATKNPDYWQKGFPKADEVEFRIILSDDARIAQLQSGQIDYSQSATGAAYLEYVKLEKDKKIKLNLNEGPTAINYDLLNTAIPPFSNRDCRLAAAQALDMETLIKLRAPGFDVANGPFAKGTLGYLADTGYPKFNLDAAKASFEKCKANGPAFAAFTMATTTAPEAVETRNVKKQMVERAGFSIRTVEIPQDSYIPAALVGSFQWQTWRNHGGVDPDGERIWWSSETAIAAPGIALNFGRVKDGNIDAALDQIRGSSDPVVRKRAAEIVNTTFADQVYAIWNWPSKYILASCNTCTGFSDTKLPDGEKSMPFLGGVTGMNYLTGK